MGKVTFYLSNLVLNETVDRKFVLASQNDIFGDAYEKNIVTPRALRFSMVKALIAAGYRF